MDTRVCGSNKYFINNNTIHFVVTGAADCSVHVGLAGSIQLTTKLDSDINNFYRNNGRQKLIDSLAAMLNIADTSRIKIVEVSEGSVVVAAVIEENEDDEHTTA